MFILRNEIQFDTAHYLSGYSGKCSNIHGHRYRLIVEIAAEELHQQGQLRGMVDDFGNIKQALKEIADWFDHTLLLEDNPEGQALATALHHLPNQFAIQWVPYRPTAEEMSRDIFYRLKAKNLAVYSVEIFETPTNSCIYREV